MTAQADNRVTPSVGRGVRIALVVSLAINLLVAGVVIGGLVSGRGPGGFPGYDLSLGPFAQALDPQDRAALRDEFRKRADLRPIGRRDRAQALSDFLTALRSDPFDIGAVEAIFAGQRDRATAAMSAGQAVLLDRIGQMTPEARAAFADRLSRELGRHAGNNPDRP